MQLLGTCMDVLSERVCANEAACFMCDTSVFCRCVCALPMRQCIGGVLCCCRPGAVPVCRLG
jgi:hypothetical protein